ncbi:response regulator [Spirosoma sp. BT702]|uniref:histidine kinase n=1 Tax=Spirosoma profusum TaxID=2771354 RepID=A0A927ATZ5_9BACT|nr:hybrid sensor histidine kinase/response regulator transcription factor [Spirosoma profusum]MBD2701637.1 response regulator [Spirosoma profusum]
MDASTPTIYSTHKKRRQKNWLLLTVILVLQGALLYAQGYRLSQPEQLTSKDGLPQGYIAAILQDRQGFIWMGTRDGLCRYDGQRFKIFQPSADGRPSLIFSAVNSLFLDHRGFIWVVSVRGDIDRFDPVSETFINVWPKKKFHHPEQMGTIARLCVDHQDRLWISFFNNSGLVCYDIRTDRIRRFFWKGEPRQLYNHNSIQDIVEDHNGTIWAGTGVGLDRFSERTGQFKSYPFPPAKHDTNEPNKRVQRLFVLSDSQLVIGSLLNFVTFLNPQKNKVRLLQLPQFVNEYHNMSFVEDSRGNLYLAHDSELYRFTPQGNLQTIARFTGEWRPISLFIDRSDVLWLGTNGYGIRKYDLRAYPFETAVYQHPFPADVFMRWLNIPRNETPRIFFHSFAYNFRYTVDKQGKLWVNNTEPVFYQYDLNTRKKTQIVRLLPKKTPDNHRFLLPLATDPKGIIWTLDNGQPYYIDTVSRQWKEFTFAFKLPSNVIGLQIVVDDQAIWLATDLEGFLRLDRTSGQIQSFRHKPTNPKSISSNSLYWLSGDSMNPNRLWIGTFGNGLCMFDKRTYQSKRITIDNGLPNNVVYSATSDKLGYLWLSTNKGISRLDTRTFKVLNFSTDDGLLANEFNRFHVVHLPDDRIILGGVEGITAFYPDQIKTDKFAPKVFITNIKVNNQPLRTSQNTRDTSSQSSAVQGLTELRLPHDQNFLAVDFAVMQFNKPGKNRYRHWLDGLEKKWIETERPDAFYTNLSPGSYTLKLNASNTSGSWSPYIRMLRIIIRPPFWATWWAYGMYTLTLLGIGYGLLRSYTNRLKLRQTMAMQEQEATQLRKVDEMKTRFFSNITHEFRTPLTLIMAPAEQMMRQIRDEGDNRRLSAIHRNANQLLQLINQLLDLTKMESGAMSANESLGNISTFVDEIVQSFCGQAESKSIELTYRSTTSGQYWFDSSKLERIVYNLVSNALKFTPDGGRVDVLLNSPTDNSIQLAVSDTGMGIPADKLPHIFDRFYQVDDSSTRQQEGTGIGLALVKELVDFQQGKLQVTSETDESSGRSGTTFRIDLPYRSVAKETDATSPISVSSLHDERTATTEIDDDEIPTLLLVEDNTELAEFIIDSLPSMYRVHRASNGKAGYEQALQLIPDLIISDVLMPEMDGYTLCKLVKDDQRTSHVPVLLLTAKSAIESRMTGLELGADDYMNKPFHVPELQQRVHNMLENRRKLRDRLKANLTKLHQPEDVSESGLNDTFLDKLYALIDKKLDDTSFGVEEILPEIGMSRMSLHRKLKALTGLPISDVIRNYRLKKAAQLLRQGYNNSQTAYMVGFDSSAYFTKCFHELYGLTPRAYANQEPWN